MAYGLLLWRQMKIQVFQGEEREKEEKEEGDIGSLPR